MGTRKIHKGEINIRTLVISDIHGCHKQSNQMLINTNYKPDTEKLILLGDYVDRGIKSKDVVEQVKRLYEEWGVVALRGNHDQMMIDAFEKDEDDTWLYNGGGMTIQSYVGLDYFSEDMFDWDEYLKAKDFIAKHYSSHLDFLKSLKFYHETEEHIFVHAGINPMYENWKHTTENEFIWIRDMFYRNQTNLDKTIVFGHTPTEHIHGTSDIWFGEDKIGIDGACAYGRQLNCLEIYEEGYKTHKVLKNG